MISEEMLENLILGHIAIELKEDFFEYFKPLQKKNHDNKRKNT